MSPRSLRRPGSRSPWFRLGCCVLVAGLVAAACGTSESVSAVAAADVPRAAPDLAVAGPVADASSEFGFDLYQELAADQQANLIFSPHSIAVALAMTRAGAVGDTAASMDDVLHLDGIQAVHPGFNALDQMLETRAGERERFDGSSATLELNIANALWGQAGLTFEPPFLETLAENYGAGMRLVDYQQDAEGARVEINDWVAEETADRITDLIPEGGLNSLTRLVLTNAVYLLAPWEIPFDEGATAPSPFTLIDGSTVDAETMRLFDPLSYGRVGEVQAVELPYVGRELAMLVLVPDEGRFADVESTLGPELLADIEAAMSQQEVQLSFPRFEFRTQAGLAGILRSLGMDIAFDPDRADFSAMTTEDELFITDVVHEAFISVDEEGTEAAAATAVVMGTTSAPAEPIELVVDRPFVFLLRDTETGAILFMGRVLNPNE